MSSTRQTGRKRFRFLGRAVVANHHAQALACQCATDDGAHASRAARNDGHAAFNLGILAHGLSGDRKFNYGDAPPEILERVVRLDGLCRSFGVPLAAAALQFPYAHPAVATVLNGARSAAEVRENVASFEHVIPADLWIALRDKGLIDPRAPLPMC